MLSAQEIIGAVRSWASTLDPDEWWSAVSLPARCSIRWAARRCWRHSTKSVRADKYCDATTPCTIAGSNSHPLRIMGMGSASNGILIRQSSTDAELAGPWAEYCVRIDNLGH
jgi:hypothetical protein